jgi:hypothetical protein
LAPAYVDHHGAIFAVGALWNLTITVIAIVGLKAVARVEWLIVIFEYAVLLIVAAVAITALLHGHTAATFIALALSNAASSLGLISIVFYGLTAAAAFWQQRATLTSSVGDFVCGGVLPSIGVLFSGWVLLESLYSGAVTPLVLGYGLGPIGVGAVVAIFLHRVMAVRFFERIPTRYEIS